MLQSNSLRANARVIPNVICTSLCHLYRYCLQLRALFFTRGEMSPVCSIKLTYDLQASCTSSCLILAMMLQKEETVTSEPQKGIPQKKLPLLFKCPVRIICTDPFYHRLPWIQTLACCNCVK